MASPASIRLLIVLTSLLPHMMSFSFLLSPRAKSCQETVAGRLHSLRPSTRFVGSSPRPSKLVPPADLLNHLRNIPFSPSNPFLLFDLYERHFAEPGYREKNAGARGRRGARGLRVNREVICLNVVLEKSSYGPRSVEVYKRGRELFLSSLPDSLNEYTLSSFLKMSSKHSPDPSLDAIFVRDGLVANEWSASPNGVVLSMIMKILVANPDPPDLFTIKSTLSSMLPLLPSKQDSAGGFNVLLNHAVRSQNETMVQNVLDRMSKLGIMKDKFTFSTVAAFLLRSAPGDEATALKVEGMVEEMSANGVKWDNELGSMIVKSALAFKKGGGVKAVEYAKTMEQHGLPVTNATRGDVVEALCQDGDLQEAISYYRGCMSSSTCAPLIRELSLTNQFPLAYRVFKNFAEAEHLEPSEFLYSEIIKSAGDECKRIMMGEGVWEDKLVKARAVAELAKQIFEGISNEEFKNVVVYNGIIRVLGEAHEVEEAFNIYRSMQVGVVVEPNIITYGSLMAACERSGSVGKVDEVFSEMKKNRITPNDFVCGAAISCFKKKGRWNRAVKLLEKMIKDRSIVVTTSTFNTVLSAVCDAGEVDRASDVMNMMRASGATHNSQTYRVFIEALCAAKRPTIAADLLVEMKREGVPCSTDLYVAVVTSLEQKRNYKKALSVYALMTASR